MKIKKKHLPKKICIVCKRPFLWRKKWEKNWLEVKYCSQRCRLNKNNIQMLKIAFDTIYNHKLKVGLSFNFLI